jgi:hypothetical protein
LQFQNRTSNDSLFSSQAQLTGQGRSVKPPFQYAAAETVTISKLPAGLKECESEVNVATKGQTNI